MLWGELMKRVRLHLHPSTYCRSPRNWMHACAMETDPLKVEASPLETCLFLPHWGAFQEKSKSEWLITG